MPHPAPSLAEADVAIVHDWMPALVGAERVVQQMVTLFPNCRLYTLFDFLTDDEREELLQGRPLTVSRLNALPGVRRYYRYLLSECVRAIEGFDVTGADFVLSSASSFSKGVLTAPGQRHFSYVHTPARYAWDMSHDYMRGIDGIGAGLKRAVARRMMHRFRLWDAVSANSVDHFIANSQFVRERIWKAWRREAAVIHPPVDVAGYVLGEAPRGAHFLTAGRLAPHKKVPLIAAAFARRPDLRLRIVGEGPDLAAVRAAAGPNVEILGRLPKPELRAQMQTARAFVFACQDDFGIAPLEAQACGTPVIALGAGGARETIRPLDHTAPTGAWFREQTVESLLRGLAEFEAHEAAIDPAACRANAERFSPERFRRELAQFVAERL